MLKLSLKYILKYLKTLSYQPCVQRCKKMIDKKDSSLDLTKFSKGEIYLYFATPILKEDLLNFIKNSEYLDHSTWKDDMNNIDKIGRAHV